MYCECVYQVLPFIISLVSICPVTTSLGMYWTSPCTAETSQHQSINRKDTATHFKLIYTTLEILCVKNSWKYVWLLVPVFWSSFLPHRGVMASILWRT